MVTLLKALGVPVVLSSDLAPEFREYERSLVTAANAGLVPKLRSYIKRLEESVAPTRVVLMHSAGGWLPASIAAEEPVKLALSGPAGGIAGVRATLDAESFEQGVAFDIGGTSTDVSLVGNEAKLRPETPIAGLPLRTPSLDIHTIGAGGGSVAWLDAGGALHVGPESAGAMPGPACYDRGGKRPTLTDALVVLGRLPHDIKLGGEMPIRAELARTAMKAVESSGQPRRIADAIVRVALAGIERALRRVTVERGHHLSGMALVPFGGAGGLLACDLAEFTGMDQILIPREPGLLCALGMLHTPASRDLSRTFLMQESETAFDAVMTAADELISRGESELRDCGLTGKLRSSATLDVRYVGQSFELNVPLNKSWKRAFIKAHEKQFHFDRGDAPAEIVNVRIRVEANQRAPKIPLSLPKAKARPISKAEGGEPVYERSGLPVGASLRGPAIITELSTCVYLKKGWTLKVTESGQLLLNRGRGAKS